MEGRPVIWASLFVCKKRFHLRHGWMEAFYDMYMN